MEISISYENYKQHTFLSLDLPYYALSVTHCQLAENGFPLTFSKTKQEIYVVRNTYVDVVNLLFLGDITLPLDFSE